MSPKRASIEFRNNIKALKERTLSILLSPYRFFRVLCFSIGLGVLLLSAVTGFFAYRFYRSLPDLRSMTFEQLKSTAQIGVDKKLKPVGKKLEWAAIDKIHRDFLYTVVMSEDSEFFEHEGVDYDAIIDSALRNLKAKKIETGASTITQQVIKNIFLTSDRAIIRKVREILIAQSLEKHFSKNQILELYLNVAEFGPDIYGARAAAHHYFEKTPDEINAAEGAFIALMLPSPRRYHYSLVENQNIPKSKRKKLRNILGGMLANEFISAKQYREYLKYDYHAALSPEAGGRPASERGGKKPKKRKPAAE